MSRPQNQLTPQQILLILFILLVLFGEYFTAIIVIGGFVFILITIYRYFQSQFYISSLKDMLSGKEPKSSISPNFLRTMEEFRLRPSHIAMIIGLILLVLIIIDGLVSVPAGHVAVIFDRGRGVLEEPVPEGLHLKIPFWQSAYLMDTRLQSYTMSIASGEGELLGDDSIESLTKDGQKVYIDITTQYRLKGNDAPWIYREVGPQQKYIADVVRPGIRNVVRDVITGYDSTKLFTQETRLEAQRAMFDRLSTLYEKKRIHLEEVLLRNIQFSEIYLQSIEDKQVAQQRIQKAEYERQEAEKLKEKKIIEAQAESEAIRLKGETLKANPGVIQYEFVQKMAPQINWGILPNSAVPLLDVKNLTQ